MKNQILPKSLANMLFALILTMFSCQKENINSINSDVAFSIDVKNSLSLKSSEDFDLENIDRVVITIQHWDGRSTDYNQEELTVFKIGEEFITKKIALPLGGYKITEFYVVDTSNNILFLCPLEGSLMAQNVVHPLPLSFLIESTFVSTVEVEVISASGFNPSDFGLVTFPFSITKTFPVLINVSEVGKTKLLSADLTIKNSEYSYFQQLDSIVDNIARIKDGFEKYVLTISRTGYLEFTDTLTNDEIKKFMILPYIVELIPDHVEDVDGNIYKVVKIGNQIWMAENLRSTHFSDGGLIESYSYDNNPDNDYPYGKLYNWKTALNGESNSKKIPSGVQGACPCNWHIPSELEWLVLMNYLGGVNEAAGKLKEIGMSHWLSPNTGATNISKFNAIGSGCFCNGTFYQQKEATLFMSATFVSVMREIHDRVFIIYYDHNSVHRVGIPNCSISIRCLRD